MNDLMEQFKEHQEFKKGDVPSKVIHSCKNPAGETIEVIKFETGWIDFLVDGERVYWTGGLMAKATVSWLIDDLIRQLTKNEK